MTCRTNKRNKRDTFNIAVSSQIPAQPTDLGVEYSPVIKRFNNEQNKQQTYFISIKININ